MAQNITLLNADYPDVPAVELPKTGGGTALFYDTTIASDGAASGDILDGKMGYVNGTLVTGSASLATATVSGTTLILTNGFPVIPVVIIE